MTLTAQELQSENERVAKKAQDAADTKKYQDLQAAFTQSVGVAGRDAGAFLIKGIRAKPEEMMMLGFKMLDSFTKNAKAGIDYALFADKHPDIFTKDKDASKGNKDMGVGNASSSGGGPAPTGGGQGGMSKVVDDNPAIKVAAGPQMM